MITPEEIEEYLGAYALDAVDDDERAAIEQYLATHPRARAEVAEHQEVATLLAFTGTRAPEGLWDRIARNLEGEEPAPAPGPELAKVMPMRPADRARRNVRRGLFALVGAAAAAVIVALGLVVADQRSELDDRDVALEAQRDELEARAVALEAGYQDALNAEGSREVAIATADGSVTVDAVVTADGEGYLRGDALEDLGADRTYQLWAILPDQPAPISLGVLGPDPTLAAFHTDADNATLAISAEQRGGVAAPTEVVATGELG